MPISAPQWTEFLTCPICSRKFNENPRQPISLGCGHTICKSCLSSLHRTVCPFDQSAINLEVELLPVNYALLQLVGYVIPPSTCPDVPRIKEHESHYLEAKKCIEELALFLRPLVPRSGSSDPGSDSLTNGPLSRPMHRKLVTLVNCQLAEEEGCARVMRAVRSLGERTVLEFILLHQNPSQLSQHLWIAVRSRGCQFLGPAMQEDALKYILLALEGGEALSRKVLVLFVVQRLEQMFPHASKTSIGHVVQLLYRASCFKVTKRDDESSLMQLKEQFRTYDALRREHDSQIVQIALEAGLRISPEQWSALLYGDQGHKSHMQSIIDKLQTPESFASSIQELTIALQRSSDPAQLGRLREHFELLSRIDGSPDAKPPSWQDLEDAVKAVNAVVQGLVEFTKTHGTRVKTTSDQPVHSKFKTSMCRDAARGSCPRGANCTFAHSDDELDKYRRKAKATRPGTSSMVNARGLGGLSDQQQYTPINHNDEPLESGHGSRNASIRSSHCLTGNGQDYGVNSSSYGQLMHRGHNNHNNHDVMVQQLRNLSLHPSQSMYSGQDNAYNMRASLGSDCLTPPHSSEQTFSYPSYYRQPIDGRGNGYSSLNGNGQMNGHLDGVGRNGSTRTSPLTVEEEASINGLNGVNGLSGMNGINGINGMNGVNGMNGMMNGHSDYSSRQTRPDDLRRRKSDIMNYPVGQRYRCAQYATPSGYSSFHSSQFYPTDVNPRFGPVGTRILPDIDRYGAFPHYQSSSLSPRGATRIDGRLEFMHNASFHPHPFPIEERLLWGRSPCVTELHDDKDSPPDRVMINFCDVGSTSMTDSSITDSETKSRSYLNEDPTQPDDSTYTRPHLSSVSSGVSSGDSYTSHSPQSHSPVGSPQQQSPDNWTGTGDSDLGSSLWSNGDFPPAPYLPQRSDKNRLVPEAQVWTPRNSELNGWPDRQKDTVNEGDNESAMWPQMPSKKRSNHKALLDSYSSCSGYWSDPEVQRHRQIKDDEIIARHLQDEETPEVTPSAPPDIYHDNSSDAVIALELQNMENEKHEVKVEKERKQFEERKEKEILKMKQEEEDRQMAIRIQNEEDGVTFVTDEATIRLHEQLYKEKQERMKKQNSKENQEKKDRKLAESLVYEDAYKHGLLPRPDPELAKPVTYPVRVVPRGSHVTSLSAVSASGTHDVVESSLP